MIAFLLRRFFIMVWTLVGISVLVFVIIQLPPGDYLTTYIAEIQAQGEEVSAEKVQFLREQYGLDKPMWQQYLVWATGLLKGDLGYSFEYNQPVADVIGDRLFLTLISEFPDCHLRLRRFVPDRRLFGHAPLPAGPITRCPSSASSASPRRTSCWLSFSSTSPTSGSVPRSAA